MLRCQAEAQETDKGASSGRLREVTLLDEPLGDMAPSYVPLFLLKGTEMDDLLQVLQNSLITLLIVIIPVLFAILTRALVSYLKTQQLKLERDGRESEAYVLDRLTSLAIAAAEEIYDEQERSGKLEYASQQLSRIAGDNGLDLSEEDTRLLIEGSLKQIKGELRSWDYGPARIE